MKGNDERYSSRSEKKWVKLKGGEIEEGEIGEVVDVREMCKGK